MTTDNNTTISAITPTGQDRQKTTTDPTKTDISAPANSDAKVDTESSKVDWEKRFKDTQRALQEEKAKNTKKSDENKPADASKTVTQDELNALSSEFIEKGVLSDESYQRLAAKGYPKEMVDGYIAGKKYEAENLRTGTLAMIDADTTKAQGIYDQMIEWASDNFDDKEAEEYDALIASTSLTAKRSAVSYLMQRYLNANPQNKGTSKSLPTPTLPTKGDTSVPTQADAGHYNSMAEMRKDLKDPRYQKDLAFRALVDQKTLKAKALGKI